MPVLIFVFQFTIFALPGLMTWWALYSGNMVGTGVMPPWTDPVHKQRAVIIAAVGICVPLFILLVFGQWWGLAVSLLATGAVWLTFCLIEEHNDRPDIKAQREQDEQQEHFANLQARLVAARFPPAAEFERMFFDEYQRRCAEKGIALPAPDTLTLMRKAVTELYEGDLLLSPSQEGELRMMDAAMTARLQPLFEGSYFWLRTSNPERAIEEFQGSLLDCLLAYTEALPPIAEGAFRVPVTDLIDTKGTVNRMLGAFTQRTKRQKEMTHLLLYGTLHQNWHQISKSGKPVFPPEFDGTGYPLAQAYFKDTPLLPLFRTVTPIQFDKARFTHQWVVAPTGSGKTQLLQSQIVADLEKVKDGASLIVIDSQGMGEGMLLSNLCRLKIFAKGEALDGKLVVLQPDPKYPLALNLFDMGQFNTDLSERDRQILHTSALKMITFCLAGTTDQQQDMIEYLVQLAMVIPGATIDTVRRMLIPKGIEEFRPYLDQVDETVRDYFLHVFNTQSQSVTKEAVMRRIMGMLKNPTFRRMYQNERNKFNMLHELDQGKVIVINTDVALLGNEACELFGRFFIALLVQATQQREGRVPVYCYVDECQDYIAADENIASLLDKARKQNVAFIFAHQRLANIRSPNVLDALSNVAIKFAGGNDTDAPTLARFMRTTPEFISNQPTGSFALFVRNQTPAAIKLKVQGFVMENLPQMSDAEQREMEREIRERYCISGETKPPPPPSSRGPHVADAEWEDVVN